MYAALSYSCIYHALILSEDADKQGLLLVNGCAAFQLQRAKDMKMGGGHSVNNWYMFFYNRDRWLVGPS